MRTATRLYADYLRGRLRKKFSVSCTVYKCTVFGNGFLCNTVCSCVYAFDMHVVIDSCEMSKNLYDFPTCIVRYVFAIEAAKVCNQNCQSHKNVLYRLSRLKFLHLCGW